MHQDLALAQEQLRLVSPLEQAILWRALEGGWAGFTTTDVNLSRAVELIRELRAAGIT